MAQEKLNGIVIDMVRHSDRYNIVTLYTRERGRLSFLSPAGSGRSGRMLRARLQPLAVVRAEIRFRENRDIQMLGGVELGYVWRSLYFDPVKSALVMFVSEFLDAFLRQSAPDTALWDYIFESLGTLDGARGGVANWHLAFLIGLLPHAGIQPDLSRLSEGGRLWFDMREGALTGFMPLHKDMLDDRETAYLPLMMRMTQLNSRRYRFAAADRRRILLHLLHYYAVHYPGIENLRSPSVLQDTFS